MGWNESRERVQRFNEALGQLEKSYQHKVRKIIEHQCLEQINPRDYICKPIAGYNTTTYRLNFIPIMAKYGCSCQGYKIYNRCSHVEALRIYLKINGIEVLQPTLF